MKISIALFLSLAGCVLDRAGDPRTSCVQQAEQACDPADHECQRAVLDDCAPPACDAPPGQHC